jgi:hypothetical protein
MKGDSHARTTLVNVIQARALLLSLHRE